MAAVAPNVDTWLVVTPHDLADSHNFLVFGGDAAGGNGDESEANYSYTMPPLALPLDVDLGAAVAAAVANCSVLSSPGAGGVPLLWGSVVPLYFLLAGANANASAVILSVPSRRLTDNAVPMTAELLRVGQALARVAAASPKRIGLVISGDLAHTYLPGGPYGWSPDAHPFDDAVALWLWGGANAGHMETLKKLAPSALSCAYAGLAVLAGVSGTIRLALKSLFGPVAPGYYGMLVAQFSPVQ